MNDFFLQKCLSNHIQYTNWNRVLNYIFLTIFIVQHLEITGGEFRKKKIRIICSIIVVLAALD